MGMVVPAAALIVPSILNLIGNVVGTGMQARESGIARTIADRYRQEDKEMIKEQQAYDRKAREKEFEWTKGEADRKWKWMEEDRNYQRGQDFVNRFTSFLDRDPKFKNNLVNIWRK